MRIFCTTHAKKRYKQRVRFGDVTKVVYDAHCSKLPIPPDRKTDFNLTDARLSYARYYQNHIFVFADKIQGNKIITLLITVI